MTNTKKIRWLEIAGYLMIYGAVDSVIFIEFLLEAIRDVLHELENTEQVSVQVTEQVGKLLVLMGDEPMSSNEIMKLLGLKHRPTFRDNYLLPAIDAGFVKMTIPDKPNSSKQKYKKIKR